MNMNIWDRILSSLQQKINRQSFNTWLKPTQQLTFADGTLHVEVPSLLFADWINRNYLPLIQESAREIEGSELRLHFTSRQPWTALRQPADVFASSSGAALPEVRTPAAGRRAPYASNGNPAAAHSTVPPPATAADPPPAPLGTGLN